MANPNNNAMRAVLGPNLQGGALRAILILAAFAFVGACLAWLAH
ncbi:MAG: hypothetical protein RQ966_15870 [Acetobacteraceae bacterium]|nr:hypothetical protein [Acetobacteraceae bacterium]